MGPRLLILLAVACAACSCAVAAAAHSRSAAAAVPRVPRIPALPARNTLSLGRCPIPVRFRPAFVRAAEDTGFQLSMLVAVAEVESRFKPNARSQADARGLLQVLPSTGRLLNLSVDTPATNVLAGARYLKILLDRYQRTDLALAAYNAGPTAVDRAGGAPGPETLAYIANVQARWAALKGCS
jgi:peptidoglycan DL-endopeptidase CwlO